MRRLISLGAMVWCEQDAAEQSRQGANPAVQAIPIGLGGAKVCVADVATAAAGVEVPLAREGNRRPGVGSEAGIWPSGRGRGHARRNGC